MAGASAIVARRVARSPRVFPIRTSLPEIDMVPLMLAETAERRWGRHRQERSTSVMSPPRWVRSLRGLALAVLALCLAACATGFSRHGPTIHSVVGATERGEASWYGPERQGRLTTSGEPFDMHKLTAAHPTLPLGTRL